MTPHLGTLFETLQKWKTASQLPDCPNRSSMLETIARDTATRYLIPRTPQQPCTYQDWVQWGHSIQSHATMHLAQCGLHYADGIWGPDGPSQPEARKRQSQTLEDILRDLKPASGGGMLDALLCEVDEHGSAMPCYSKEGLTHAVKSQIESWSSDKATGTTAFALTHAFTDTLFHTTIDRRGLTRSTLRSDVEVSTHAAHHASTFRQVATYLRDSIQDCHHIDRDTAEIIADMQRATSGLHLYQSSIVDACYHYTTMLPDHKRLVQHRYHSCRLPHISDTDGAKMAVEYVMTHPDKARADIDRTSRLMFDTSNIKQPPDIITSTPIWLRDGRLVEVQDTTTNTRQLARIISRRDTQYAVSFVSITDACISTIPALPRDTLGTKTDVCPCGRKKTAANVHSPVMLGLH